MSISKSRPNMGTARRTRAETFLPAFAQATRPPDVELRTGWFPVIGVRPKPEPQLRYRRDRSRNNHRPHKLKLRGNVKRPVFPLFHLGRGRRVEQQIP